MSFYGLSYPLTSSFSNKDIKKYTTLTTQKMASYWLIILPFILLAVVATISYLHCYYEKNKKVADLEMDNDVVVMAAEDRSATLPYVWNGKDSTNVRENVL